MTEQQIEVGQRWLGKMSKREYKVVCVNHKSVCIENEHGVLYTDYLDDFSDCYTLIPEWQPEPGDVVEVSDCGKEWFPAVFISEKQDATFRYHISDGSTSDGTRWKYIRPCEPTEIVPMQPPKYRSFEIDWSHEFAPSIYEANGEENDCEIGHTIDGYRIYGYGDCPNADAMVSYESYATQPCNHDGDAVYAYGRYVGGE